MNRSMILNNNSREGTTILKFFLNISLEEQKERFQERLEMPEKRWKFNPGDLEERKLWPEYMKASKKPFKRPHKMGALVCCARQS